MGGVVVYYGWFGALLWVVGGCFGDFVVRCVWILGSG